MSKVVFCCCCCFVLFSSWVSIECKEKHEIELHLYTYVSIQKLQLHCILPMCDRLWEKGAFGAENKNVVFNLF